MQKVLNTEWTTPKALAEALLVHPRTIRREIDRGNLPAAKIGLQWRITLADAEKWIQNATNEKKG